MSGEGGIVVVDVGIGNLRSVERALHAALGAEVPLPRTDDPARLRDAAVVVFPGQGAFGDCAAALRRHGGALSLALRDHIAAGRPYLGICLGLQVLLEESDEAPGRSGLGVFRGRVERLKGGVDRDGGALKIPHMGWNTVRARGEGARWINDGAWFYFVHSYAVRPEDEALVAGESAHGETFCCALARGNLLGVQFHPEKSQREGIALLRSWFRAMEAAQ